MYVLRPNIDVMTLDLMEHLVLYLIEVIIE
jgi:hypothetical protein